MHAEAYAWLSRVVRERVLPAVPSPPTVLEVGSYDVNGSCRPLFSGAIYVGVDRIPGPGVDVVTDIADLHATEQFDVAVSTETLEHMPAPVALLLAAHRALRPGGLLVLTAAADPRLPHRCDGSEGNLRGEHYANIHPTDLRHLLTRSGFLTLELEHDAQHGDVYALAVKA